MNFNFGKYFIWVDCENCGSKVKIGVPKGTTVKDFAEMRKAKCNNCGCTIEFKEFKTEWLK